ncbi:MAG: AmmeMemoRadiSam system radical SAM enzyme [candidate division Zixibacteria bacterium RBG_16_53_22]|nr:MAG: AmmeMemoRadiSam system radical SAM enzyme [candidate division Zixibacteria bacterium RBG_16_53_22]
MIRPLSEVAADNSKLEYHPAQFYKKLADLEIECELCPRKCAVGDKERGFCGVRENKGGEYYTLVYGNPCSTNIDPIEKKPFFHFFPGSSAFSIATAGCNLNCKFCQNWQISQFRPEQIRSMKYSPDEIASMALQYGCRSIAYTYSEPTVFYEYMLDCAIAAEQRGVKSVMVSAGFISPEPMKKLLPHLSAVKIDLKAFDQEYYSNICNGELKPVLDTLVLLKNSGIWFEIVYLMLPTLNDDPGKISKLCSWIIDELGPDIPIHFTRFHPEYLLKNLPSTPIASLEQACQIARKTGLNYPYVGNVYGHKWENTYCPGCQSEIITRSGFQVSSILIENGRCKKCGRQIPGIWS